jgi:tight adherence protein B
MLPLVISLLVFVSAFLLVRYGYGPALRFRRRQEAGYDRVLRRQLLLDIEPRQAFYFAMGGVVAAAVLGGLITSNLVVALVCGALAFFVPALVVRHMETKRRTRLETQLVDGLTTLAAGVRAGLNLVQAMELVVDNHVGPIKQEFGQLIREYHMGMDLNQAMRAASNRIGSPLYRLTFTAIEMHRIRGGDAGESMDRIAESVREIKKLEGKLVAITAQSRSQASMMAVMPIVFIIILYFIDPEGIKLLFTETVGRIILLICFLLILGGFLWIRKIMAVDV